MNEENTDDLKCYVCPYCKKTMDKCYCQDEMELRITIDNFTKKDIIEIIELAVYLNKIGFNRTMIDDSKDDMIDYLYENLNYPEMDTLVDQWRHNK